MDPATGINITSTTHLSFVLLFLKVDCVMFKRAKKGRTINSGKTTIQKKETHLGK
ncbi:MAG: hypothetical protein ABIP35_08845 [Ginsengibacter sp.]